MNYGDVHDRLKMTTRIQAVASSLLGTKNAEILRRMHKLNEDSFEDKFDETYGNLHKLIKFINRPALTEEEIIMYPQMPFEYSMAASEAERFFCYMCAPAVSMSMLFEFVREKTGG